MSGKVTVIVIYSDMTINLLLVSTGTDTVVSILYMNYINDVYVIEGKILVIELTLTLMILSGESDGLS